MDKATVKERSCARKSATVTTTRHYEVHPSLLSLRLCVRSLCPDGSPKALHADRREHGRRQALSAGGHRGLPQDTGRSSCLTSLPGCCLARFTNLFTTQLNPEALAMEEIDIMGSYYKKSHVVDKDDQTMYGYEASTKGQRISRLSKGWPFWSEKTSC